MNSELLERLRSSCLSVYLYANTTGYIYRRMRRLPEVGELSNCEFGDLVDVYNRLAGQLDDPYSEPLAAAILVAISQSDSIEAVDFLRATNPSSRLWLEKMRKDLLLESRTPTSKFLLKGVHSPRVVKHGNCDAGDSETTSVHVRGGE